MDKINVIWLSYHEPEILARGYWDQGLLEDIFKQGNFKHYINFAIEGAEPGKAYPWYKHDGEGAVVIINGRTHVEDAEKINADIAKLRWVLFIETGDEEASFEWREIKHPIMRFWIMLPRMNEHNDTNYKIPNGYRPETRELLQQIGHISEKPLDVFFAGQVNHDRREQCIDAVNALPDKLSRLITTTDKFGEEKLDYQTYLTTMASSKIVLCPSGVESPDNFRVYEALEAGCIPIVDAFSSKHKHPGFWKYLFGSDIPFPILDYWDALPKLLPELLKDYPANANKCWSWWQLKKREIKFKLIDDIRELSK